MFDLSYGRVSITSTEMAIVDENSEWLGVPRLLLMENAGAAVARAVANWLGATVGVEVVVVCGVGNNGGDGMAAARHLASMGAKTTVILVGSIDKVRTREAVLNLNAVRSMKESIKFYNVVDVDQLLELKPIIDRSEVVIDAVFGTGVKGKIKEPWRTAIQLINSCKGFKLAVDIPSGLNPDTGEVEDIAVRADMTVTFHRVKKGMLISPEICGEVVIAPIGIPPEAEIIMGPGDARQTLISVSRQSGEVVLLEDLSNEAKDFMNLLGASVKMSGDGQVVYIGKRSREQNVSGRKIVGFDLDIGREGVSIITFKEAAEKYKIDITGDLHQKISKLSRISSEIEHPLYVVGDNVDLLIGASRWKMSWIDRPLNELGLNILIATILALLARGADTFEAASAAGYLAGVASSSGYPTVLNELRRLMER
ncbi:MAG: NAD(P)H-hydrate epimerase [Nitrososphaerota archaeon]